MSIYDSYKKQMALYKVTVNNKERRIDFNIPVPVAKSIRFKRGYRRVTKGNVKEGDFLFMLHPGSRPSYWGLAEKERYVGYNIAPFYCVLRKIVKP